MKHKLSTIALSIIIATSSSNAFASAVPKPAPTPPTAPPAVNDPVYNPTPANDPVYNPKPDPKPTPTPSKWDTVKKNLKKIGRPDPVSVGVGLGITGLGALVDYLLDPANNSAKLPEPATTPQTICYYNVISGSGSSGYYSSFEEVFKSMTPKGATFIEKRDQYPKSPDLMGFRYYGWYSRDGSYFHYGDVSIDCTKPQPEPAPAPAPEPSPSPAPAPAPAPEPSPSPAPAPAPAPEPSPEKFELPAFCAWATKVCDFIDWVQKDDGSDDTKIDVPDERPQMTSTEIKFNGQCPNDIVYNVSFGGKEFTLFSFEWSKFCQFLAYLKVVIIAMATFGAVKIVGGVNVSD